jgi:hypothetical protein
MREWRSQGIEQQFWKQLPTRPPSLLASHAATLVLYAVDIVAVAPYGSVEKRAEASATTASQASERGLRGTLDVGFAAGDF